MSTETTPPAVNSTATVTSPIVTGDNPQPVVSSPIVEPAAAPVVENTDPNAASTTAPATTSPDPNSTPEWAQKRINELTAKRYEAERKALAAEEGKNAAERANAELLAKLAGGQTPDPNKPATPSPALNEADIERRVLEKAELIAKANEFTKTCNNVAETGKKQFTDWDDAIKNLGLVGALGQNVNPAFLETAVELKDPHRILHYLGKNLEEAEKIIKMPPTRMAMEMARVEAMLHAPSAPAPAPAISNAPAPVIPVGGAAKPGNPDINDPTTSSEDWFKLRAQQIAEKKKQYLRA